MADSKLVAKMNFENAVSYEEIQPLIKLMDLQF